MDRRLIARIKDVRQKLTEAGGLVTSDAVCDSLCKTFPEYKRAKRPILKRIASQELSVPLAPAEVGSQTLEAPAEGPRKKKARRTKGSETPVEQDPGAAVNDSLRRMYHPEAAAKDVDQERTKPTSAQSKAMRAARRAEGFTNETNFQAEPRPDERLEDLGGIDHILQDLRQLVLYPLTHPEVFSHLGVQPPTGVLLHGPPGTGKTCLAHALAGSTGVSFFKLAATEIVSGMSGESEAKIRQLFQAAIAAAPSLLFLDEVDAITPRRDNAGREMERRIVAQMLTCMDDVQGKFVIVLGATNRPDALDPALRRAGRFDREISMGIPDLAARERILAKMTKTMRLAESLDLPLLARLTPGFVGADLMAVAKEAALSAVTRAFSSLLGDAASTVEDARPFSAEELSTLAVEMSDFKSALAHVQPSARREGFTTVPDTTWEEVGALGTVREELDAAVCEPIRKVELFKQLGLTVPVGVLLFGPPGCGKTLLAKAAANASGANFISIKGPELLNKYVGESERAVRTVFQRAVSSAPCVIFFDELDALVPRRTGEGSSGAERVVNQMLTEMDGVQSRAQVFIIAATNRPDIIDPAMLRPGRLDRRIFVPLASEQGRLEIIKTHCRKLPLSDDVDLVALAKDTEGFSGADLAGLVRESAYLAIRSLKMPIPAGLPAPPPQEAPSVSAATKSDCPTKGDSVAMPESNAQLPANLTGAAEVPVPKLSITKAIFDKARSRVSPSVSESDRTYYAKLEAKLASGHTDA